MAIKYDERLIKCNQIQAGMTLVIDGQLALVEDEHLLPSQALVDVKIAGKWDYFDAVGTVTLAENIRDEADEQPQEPAGE